MTMEESEKNKKFSGENLQGKELYELKKRQKEETKKEEQRKEILTEAPKKIGRYLLYGGIVIAVIGGLGWFATNRPSLPPISMQGHIEQSPPGHIVDKPIQENIQKHMLEHADGSGKPGIIIQYNCKDYVCEPDLIQNLKTLVEKYPDNVYLAPNNYDGKIILTKVGKSQILDAFDEQIIKKFIE